MRKVGSTLQRGLQGTALVACATASSVVSANTFELEGVIETCAPLVCNLAGIGVGDPVIGYLAVDPAASGPNSTFTEADVLSYLISVGGVAAGSNDGTLEPSSVSTDGNGDLATGLLAITGTIPDFNADIAVDINVTALNWEVSTDFLNLGVVATGTVAFSQGVAGSDFDSDGVGDQFDNCTEAPNVTQIDSNGDLFGNACDADLNDDLQINFTDLGQLKAVFFTSDADADLNGDGQVNFADLGAMKAAFFGTPGPSGLVP